MASIDDDKPRIILNEYKVTQNLPKNPTTLNEEWNIKTFKKKFRIVIVRYENFEMEFDLIGIHPFLANTFRRLMLSDVPSMAIEKVHILNNTSIIQDEVLAHRLGLIPLRADPRLFELKSDADAEGGEQDTIEFELKIKCTYNKDSNKNSSRVEDLYRNNNVYSEHIKWIPIGDQKDKFEESLLGPVEKDILIAKMKPGHELDLKLFAIKSTGRDHAKFSPVATVYYRLLPDIRITRPVEEESAELLQKCFSPGVIGIKHENGRRKAVVNNARYDTTSRNIFRYEELKDCVIMSKVQDHFIFTIESVGALQPDVIFKESIKLLKEKCLSLLGELNS